MVMGPLFLIQAIENLARRHDIPFGIVQLLMGSAVVFSLVSTRPAASWVRTGILVLWVVAGMAEIALTRWIWGGFIAITGVLVLLIVREENQRRLHSKPGL